ncbi:hypothetical protein [Chthonobacter albigriseus]|uniref:hypothetical protein n=1 Tax=Chthonobacter albigriseus TaxID=1683161 RepID=UPI0015EEAB0D|nr:hypothetical protein [Chthonobacter albigriseus]
MPTSVEFLRLAAAVFLARSLAFLAATAAAVAFVFAFADLAFFAWPFAVPVRPGADARAAADTEAPIPLPPAAEEERPALVPAPPPWLPALPLLLPFPPLLPPALPPPPLLPPPLPPPLLLLLPLPPPLLPPPFPLPLPSRDQALDWSRRADGAPSQLKSGTTGTVMAALRTSAERRRLGRVMDLTRFEFPGCVRVPNETGLSHRNVRAWLSRTGFVGMCRARVKKTETHIVRLFQ